MGSAEHAGLVAGVSIGLVIAAVVTRRAYRRCTVVRTRLHQGFGHPDRRGVAPGSPRRRWLGIPLAPRIPAAFWAASRRRRSERHLLELIDGATRAVRAGSSLREALIVGVNAHPEMSVEFGRLRDDLTRRPLDESLDRFTAANPSPSVSLAVRCISLAGDTGGRPSRVLEGVSFTIRERLECGREARALATQARSSAVVMMISPIAFAMVAVSVDRRAGAFLFGSVAGLVCIAGGLALEAVGCAWMARLVRTST